MVGTGFRVGKDGEPPSRRARFARTAIHDRPCDVSRARMLLLEDICLGKAVRTGCGGGPGTWAVVSYRMTRRSLP